MSNGCLCEDAPLCEIKFVYYFDVFNLELIHFNKSKFLK